MKANRIPPERREVYGCGDCPLRVDKLSDETMDNESMCGHPDVPSRAVAFDASTPADFCPLLRAPLILSIAREAQP